jgi:hypothetical protein
VNHKRSLLQGNMLKSHPTKNGGISFTENPPH